MSATSFSNLGMTEWIIKWKKAAWRTASKTPVMNQDLWAKLDGLNSSFKKVDWVLPLFATLPKILINCFLDSCVGP
jgi:hypothetical protein